MTKTLLFAVVVLALLVCEPNQSAKAQPANAQPAKAQKDDYLAAAKQAAGWIQSAAVKTDKGTTWPADPLNPKSVNNSLYSGTPGVVLFFLEAYRTTGNQLYLKTARDGADYLLASLDDEKGTGLYEGVAGVGFTMLETFKATKDEKYRQGARRSIELISSKARPIGKGVDWNGVNDIISGSAGTGLFLMYAARELKDPAALELAARAGLRLIELGRAEAGGLKWAMDGKFPRLMPNFSHGTAGVAYFLATLYQQTKRKEFLDAALAGAKYLLAVADKENDGCQIFHHEPDGEKLFYLSWCHGPTGTARLFYRLSQITGDKTWMEWVKRSARSVMTSGIPENQTPGFWNNVSQCCGSAGVAEFFLSLHRVTRNAEYMQFAKRLTSSLLAKASPEQAGLKWIQAEHRSQPKLLIAQTGYMQGAAGIGMWLLRLHAFETGKRSFITFPDSPF